MQYAQSGNFITPRHYVKNGEAQKSLTIDTRNQLQPLENVIEEQSSKNELNMAQETTNDPRNNRTMSAKKSVETLTSSTDPDDNNFVSFDVKNCIKNLRGYEKGMLKKYRNNFSKLQKKKLIV